jgi:hypothetical protein
LVVSAGSFVDWAMVDWGVGICIAVLSYEE